MPPFLYDDAGMGSSQCSVTLNFKKKYCNDTSYYGPWMFYNIVCGITQSVISIRLTRPFLYVAYIGEDSSLHLKKPLVSPLFVIQQAKVALLLSTAKVFIIRILYPTGWRSFSTKAGLFFSKGKIAQVMGATHG